MPRPNESLRGQEQDLDVPLITARQIELHEPRGHIFGPWDFELAAGGVTLVQAPMSVQRTALLLALCGRMHLTGGTLTVLGWTDQPREVFKRSSIACLDEAEQIKPAVSVRDLVTEALRWHAPFFTWVPKADEAALAELCADTFGDIALPDLDELIENLPVVQQLLLRIAIANIGRPPLLVVGRLDQFSSDTDQSVVLERLIHIGKAQSVIVGDVNPPPSGSGVQVLDLSDLGTPSAVSSHRESFNS